MTEEELKAIKARCEAATPGPWDYDEMHQEITTPYSSDQYWLIVSEARQTPDQDYPVDQFGHTYDANFAFIAHAREDIPALLDEVERLREAQRWIPVSERTPDPTSKESIVLATMWDSVFPGCYDNGGWYSGSARIAGVTHWMPLPTPPEVQP